MDPADLRTMWDHVEEKRDARNDAMYDSDQRAHAVARRVSDMMRENAFDSEVRMKDLQKHVVEFETSWLHYLQVMEEWRQALNTYTAAHDRLSASISERSERAATD